MAQLVSDSSETEQALVTSIGLWMERPGPLYQRLACALRDALDQGIPAGASLPPERRLASLLTVSRTTVVAAYRILRAEGRLVSRQGSGTRAAGPLPSSQPVRAATFASPDTFWSLTNRNAAATDLATSWLGAEGVLTPDLMANACAELAVLAREAVGYLSHGLPTLRSAIAHHMSRQGLPTSEQQVLVTSGAQQAITLLARLLTGHGVSVAVENPTYAGALDAFGAAGARIVPVPVAWNVGQAALRQSLRRERPSVLYLMPSFHNPTGSVASAAQRQQLVTLAKEQDVLLIEDNTLEPLAIGPAPPLPLAIFGQPGDVVTIGSLSKIAWAGLRVGWIRATPQLIGQLVMLKTSEDLGSSVPSQTLGRAVLDDFERISTLRINQLRDCLDTAVRLLRTHLPDWEFTLPAGGQSLWVRLPCGDARVFSHAALQRGVAVIPGPQLSPDGSFRDYLRLQFLQPSDVLERGIRGLAAAWEEYAVASSDLGVIV
jgi:DNA-binding transcriptional MocR family regulator